MSPSCPDTLRQCRDSDPEVELLACLSLSYPRSKTGIVAPSPCGLWSWDDAAAVVESTLNTSNSAECLFISPVPGVAPCREKEGMKGKGGPMMGYRLVCTYPTDPKRIRANTGF